MRGVVDWRACEVVKEEEDGPAREEEEDGPAREEVREEDGPAREDVRRRCRRREACCWDTRSSQSAVWYCGGGGRVSRAHSQLQCNSPSETEQGAIDKVQGLLSEH